MKSPKLSEVIQSRFTEQPIRKKLQCPGCKFRMRNYRFQNSSLAVDGCPSCDIYWFDHGEMKQINQYISKFNKQTKRTIGTGVRKIQTEEQKFYEEYMSHQGFEGDLSVDQVLVQIFLGLPVEHNLPPFRTPLVTYGLIAINVFVLLFAFFTQGKWGFTELGFKPENPHLFYAFTAMFIHGGIMHLIGNIYILKVLGDNVEDLLGRTGFLLMYLASGLGGWFAALIYCPHPYRYHIGASGAVAGVMAAYFYFFPKMKFSFRLFYFFTFNVTSKAIAVIWILHQFVIKSSGTNVAWDAHLGGFAVGLAIAIFVKKNFLTN